jgi:hypothetical protein
MSGVMEEGSKKKPRSISADNNTDNSNELLEQATEFLLNSPEKKKKESGEGEREKTRGAGKDDDDDDDDKSEWTTVVSRGNSTNKSPTAKRHLYLDTKQIMNNNNNKSLGKDQGQQTSPTNALSPMTKVIREAEKFISREEKDTSKTNNKGKSSQRNLDFDAAINDIEEAKSKKKSNNNITSPPPKVKMHQKKIEMRDQDDDYFSESGGTPSPSAGRKNGYFTNKADSTQTKETNGRKEKENNRSNNENNKTVTFNTAARTIAPPSVSSSSPTSEPAFATRSSNQGRSAVSFQNLSRQSSVDQMEAMFSPSDALDAFGMPSPSGSMSNFLSESGDEGDDLSQRGKKLAKHVKIIRQESVSQIDSILEGEEYDPARHDDEEDSDEDEDGKSATCSDSDKQRRKSATSSRNQQIKGGGFGSPFKTRNKAFASGSDVDDSDYDRTNATHIKAKRNTDEDLDELYTMKDKVTEHFFAYKNKPDFTLEQAQEMLKKAEELLAGDAKSALEIDQRLMLLEQELREMRQDATIFFYGLGGICLAWTGMKVIGYVASFFG